MDWKNRVREALIAVTPDAADPDVIEELTQHARSSYDAARADGLSHEEAEEKVTQLINRWRHEAPGLHRRSKRAAMIDPPPIAGAPRLSGLVQDLRYAWRLLRRQPRFATVVVLTMALGVGATTILFSVTYGVLMKPLPWPDSDRLVLLRETRGGRAPRFGAFTNAAYLAWREDAKTVEGMAAWAQRMATLGSPGEPERIRVTDVTASLFPLIGARPLTGTLFGPENETQSVVVLSEGLWQRRFGADPGIVGKAVLLDGRPFTVVGVLQESLAYPDSRAQAWTPLVVRPAVNNSLSLFSAVAKLRPGATADQAAAEATGRGRFAPDTGLTTTAIFGGTGAIEVSAQPLRDALTSDVRQPLIILLTGVALLLVTATANIASLQLARGTARRRELAIRAALGAGRARMTRQLVIESLVLGCTGGVAGLALAWSLQRAIPAILPADFPRPQSLGVDAIVVLFALAVSIAASVAFGVLPALRLRRFDVPASLAEDGAASVGAGRRSRTAQARLLIMAGQVAIACVLLVGASLLTRSFGALLNADRGFDPDRVVTARVSFPTTVYAPDRRFAVAAGLLERIAADRRVEHVGFTSELPLTTGGSTAAFSMPSLSGDGAVVRVQASPRIVSAHFFSAIGMRVVAGRGFDDTDVETSQPVVVVNRSFARQYLSAVASPIGVQLPVAGYSTRNNETVTGTVIGVVDDIRYLTSGGVSQPEMYYSYRQMGAQLGVPVIHLLVRSGADVEPLGQAIREAVRHVDANLVAESVATLSDRVLTTLARPRLYAIVLAGFAVVALAIAAVGLFGVLSYTVAQRSRELALRTALGAAQSHIVRLIAGQALLVLGLGLAAGITASYLFTRVIASQLYGVSASDAATFTAVAIVLVIVAVLACIGPVRRATRVDPLQILRG